MKFKVFSPVPVNYEQNNVNIPQDAQAQIKNREFQKFNLKFELKITIILISTYTQSIKFINYYQALSSSVLLGCFDSFSS